MTTDESVVFLDPNDVMKKARIENAEIEMKS
jgi:hypothetical protein